MANSLYKLYCLKFHLSRYHLSSRFVVRLVIFPPKDAHRHFDEITSLFDAFPPVSYDVVIQIVSGDNCAAETSCEFSMFDTNHKSAIYDINLLSMSDYHATSGSIQMAHKYYSTREKTTIYSYILYKSSHGGLLCQVMIKCGTLCHKGVYSSLLFELI